MDFQQNHPFLVTPTMQRFSNLECAARSVLAEGHSAAVRMGERFWDYHECVYLVSKLHYNHRGWDGSR